MSKKAKPGLFKEVAIMQGNPKWERATERYGELYNRCDDIRSEFARDYNRILHCTAYRRLKHKTQVFIAPMNDHICTRIEHVNHVNSVSYTIAKFLGLNVELTDAISIGHDIGHAPFGHAGESIIKDIVEKDIGGSFWHEKNSLHFVDDCETLEDPQGFHRNLNLTYAVRDGIVCHCGEVDENSLFPRDESIDLHTIESPNEVNPYTWEGCVVKVADKIAYLGRDIEDAITLKVLTRSQLTELLKIVKGYGKTKIREINTTILMHNFITDLCEYSSPTHGIQISNQNLQFINSLKEFNYKNIYYHWRLENYKKYAKLVIESIYDMLKHMYHAENSLKHINRYHDIYPLLVGVFSEWLLKYSNLSKREDKTNRYHNVILYDLSNEKSYYQAAIDFISGMTDSFAIRIFNEITMF
ncbi:MAG: HD domain-containing protein [Thermodesulfobacteriota bacterium]|nr:HD domain-containing protein [Thermodesulfobacteriota bacterium]